ncbi:MAG: FAD-dependent oxidoreductase [Edaphobacter sp.]
MTASCDVVVVGAGIVGAACAYFLGKEGLRVVVVERGIVGGGATAAGMGHLVAMDDSPAQLALTKLSLAMWSELRTELPVGVEFRQTGTLWVAADEGRDEGGAAEGGGVSFGWAGVRGSGWGCAGGGGATVAAGVGGGSASDGRCSDLSRRLLRSFLLRDVAAQGALHLGCRVVSVDGSGGFAGGRAKSFGGVCGECCGCWAPELAPIL